MTTAEKIILSSTAMVTISAVSILIVSKKYDASTKEVIENLKDVKYILSKSREDIIVGNKDLAEGNQLLRKLLKENAEEVASKHSNDE